VYESIGEKDIGRRVGIGAGIFGEIDYRAWKFIKLW